MVGLQDGAALEGGREHFGYADGFAQPSIEGSGFPPEPGAGAVDGWRPLKPGELLLGYPDEQGAVTPAPPPGDFGINGSYLVYRKLHQDVATFRRILSDAAAHYPGGEELLAAKIVGRWRDGTPLAELPRPPGPRARQGPAAQQRVRLRRRPGRDGVPDRRARAAHEPAPQPAVRRQAREPAPDHAPRHHLRRRCCPPAREDDGKDRGVIFMCLQASLARGFEFVQSQWANGGNAFRLAEDQDVIVAPHDTDGPAKMTIPGSPPFFLGPLSRVVTTRGGEYYFTPGINGLRHLAAGGQQA